jgi:branched-chain amino acid transport system substrate-binding protein
MTAGGRWSRARVTCIGMATCAALALSACGSSSSASSAGGGSSGASGGSYTIGVLMPTTGPLAALGTQVQQATAYSVAAVNAAGGIDGHKLKLVSFDTQLDPSNDVSDFLKGVTEDHVLGFVGPLTSPEAAAVVPETAREKTPTIIVGASDASFTSPVKPYVFRVSSTVPYDAGADVRMSVKLGCKRVALMGDTSVTGLNYMAVAKPDVGSKLVTQQPFADDATDLTSQLQKIRAANATCILVGTNNLGAVGGMVKQMAETGYDIPVIGDSALTLDVFTGAATASALGKVPTYGTSINNPSNPRYVAAFAAFAKQHGGYPAGEESAAVWDAVHIYAKALAADGGKGGAALQEAVQNVTGSKYQSLTGGAGQNGFSASRHDWVPASASSILQNHGTKLTVALPSS